MIKNRSLTRRSTRRNPSGSLEEMRQARARLDTAVEDHRYTEYAGMDSANTRMGLFKLAVNSVKAQIRHRDVLLLDKKFNVLNNEAFNEKLFKFLRTRDAGSTFSFAAIDIDNMHRLNSKLKHHEVDRRISYMLWLLSKITEKRGGQIGRFGGDEFRIISPANKEVLAQDLKTALKKTKKFGLSFSSGIRGSEGIDLTNAPTAVRELSNDAGAIMLKGKKWPRFLRKKINIFNAP
ncbi:MAG: GGDEF domain-containing protein [archaeon]|jgi:diguanylate cyclase (GGDEF)-like protein